MPLAKGTENITANIPSELSKQLGQLSGECGLSKSAYVHALIKDAVDRNRRFRRRFSEFIEETGATPDGSTSGDSRQDAPQKSKRSKGKWVQIAPDSSGPGD